VLHIPSYKVISSRLLACLIVVGAKSRFSHSADQSRNTMASPPVRCKVYRPYTQSENAIDCYSGAFASFGTTAVVLLPSSKGSQKKIKIVLLATH
jgi:hypothetical protein